MALIDYLLLTPLDEEWRAVRDVLCPVFENITERPIETITYYLWKQPVNQPPYTIGEYLIAAAPMARQTPGQAKAGIVTSHSVRQWKPGRIVLLGIAGSLEPERLLLGDVVVSYEIYGYEVGDAEADGYHFRPTFNQIDALDYDRVRALRDNPVAYPKWQQECLETAATFGLKDVSRPPELHLEVTASGNYVVKSVAEGQRLRNEINHRISAVEMEARGLHQALYMEVERTDALMIRGISDYADENKAELEKTTKDGWRAFCAANAARLLKTIWQRGPVPPLSPGYELDATLGPFTLSGRNDIPNIEIKRIGAQTNTFPKLLNRSKPTPELTLEVNGRLKSGQPAPDFNSLCIVDSPQREFISPRRRHPGGVTFILPASEWGLRVELILSFPVAVDSISISCRDDFQRLSEATVERDQ